MSVLGTGVFRATWPEVGWQAPWSGAVRGWLPRLWLGPELPVKRWGQWLRNPPLFISHPHFKASS